MVKNDNTLLNNRGRSKIDSVERRYSYSKRALTSKIQTINKRCNKCGHHKAIENISVNSVYFNRIRCSRCNNIIKE